MAAIPICERGEKELSMRAFILSVLVGAVLAVGWAYGLNSFQESIATAASSASGVRLGPQEQVDYYGREAERS